MLRRLWTGMALAGLLTGGASAAQPTASAPVLAEATSRGVAVDWAVLAPYQRAVLTVSMPDGEVFRSELGPGSAPTFSAFDEQGEARPDGAYNWELRLDPVLAPDVERRLAAALARGDERAVRRIQRAHGLDTALVQSGAVTLRGGAFVTAEEPEPEPEAAAEELRPVTAADHFIFDDLIVNGNACVGLCGSGMSFPVAPFVVRAAHPNLLFDDTSSEDWAFLVNDFFGGSNQFSLADLKSSRVPFTIAGGSPASSLYVDALGRLGLGTSTPATAVHVKHPTDPILRLEGIRAWEMRVESAGFRIRNHTTGMLPFLIAHSAPSTSFHIGASGNVGLGTSLPETDLHVYGANTADTAIGIGPRPSGDLPHLSALNVGYGGESLGRGAGFFNIRPDSGAVAPNPSLRFFIANDERMILDNEGFLGLGGVVDPANPIEHTSGAVLTAGGTWQSVSSRATKRDIRPLGSPDALAALQGLAPVRFFYKSEPGDEYLGFVAEDVPDLVATPGHDRLGPLDIVAVLTKVAQQQQVTIADLTRVAQQQQVTAQQQQATIDELTARLDTLERRPPHP